MKLEINKDDIRVTNTYGQVLFESKVHDVWQTLSDKDKTNTLIRSYKSSWEWTAMDDNVSADQQIDYYMNLESVWKFLRKNREIVKAAACK